MSFTHVLLAKLFLLPILAALFFIAFIIALCFKCAFGKIQIVDKIFMFFKYFLFFNLPIWYVMEMYQDLVISALVNLSMLDRNKEFNVVMVVNIALACLFLFLTFAGVVLLLIYFCKMIRKSAMKWLSVYETFASFSPRSYPWIMHLLIFAISRFLMAIFICLGDHMPSVATAACFLVISVISFCLQLPLKIFKSIFMNLLNLTMELSLVYLALFTLISEAADLSYNSNEILGLITISCLLVADPQPLVVLRVTL